MPIVLDYNLCDGIEGCSAVSMCDAEALTFNPSSHRIEYDKEQCRNCGTCANYCGMSAIAFVPTDEEWEELRALMEASGE